MNQVLSILSHVVHGYVGNRAITFPLQYLGWNVDALNTTNFSNHPGYGTFGGSAEDPHLILKVLEGLDDINNSIGQYNMVITGYAPNAGILNAIKQSVFNRFTWNQNPMLIVDPILGDNGKIYVDKDVIPIYQEMFKSGHVDLITPNQFEFEVLSGTKISDINSLKYAMSQFTTQYKVKNIVLSSINIGDEMYSVGYTNNQMFLVPIQEIPCKFFGCGDLFTGLISHSFYHTGLTVDTLKDTIIKLTKVLENTFELEKVKNSNVKVINDIKIIPLAKYLLQDFTSVPLDIKFIDM